MPDMNRPADYAHAAGVSADQDAIVADNGGVVRLMGYSVRESAGTPAAFAIDIVDGATASGGTEIAHVEGAGDGSETKWFGPYGIAIKTQAISVNVESGTVDVTVYWKRD